MESRVWIPPYDFAVDPTVHKWALIILGAMAASVVVLVVMQAVRTKDMLPIYLFIGAVVTMSVEPFVDVQGLCWYPEVNSIPGYTSIGRTIPLYLVFVFMFYFPPAILFILNRCQKGMTAGWLVKFYLAVVLAAFLFEPLPLHYKLWTYYGDQAFVININGWLNAGFPLFFGFANGGCVVLTGVALFKVLPYLPGWKKIAVIPLMPVFVVGFWTCCAFYVSTPLNTFLGVWATRLGTVAMALTSLLVVWLAGQLVSEKPYRVNPRLDSVTP